MFRKRMRRALTVPITTLLLVFLLACGSSHSVTPSPSSPEQQIPTGFLYLAGQGQILGFAINSDGSLTALSSTPAPANANVVTKTMAVDPNAKFLFVDDVINNGIYVYSIDPNSGGLTLVTGSPFTSGTSVVPGIAGGVLTDSTGKFLYFASISGSATFTVDAQSGALTPTIDSPFSETNGPFEMVLDTSGKFMYADDLNNPTSEVSGFAIDSTSGGLTALANSPFPTVLNTDALGTHLLVAGKFLFRNSLLDNKIEEWSIDETSGDLATVSGSPFSVGLNPVNIAADGEGKFLYVANLGVGTISGYDIDSNTGELTAMPGSPFTVGASASALAVDPSGKFLYAVNPAPTGGTIMGFRIDSSTGALTAFSQPFATGAALTPFTQVLAAKAP